MTRPEQQQWVKEFAGDGWAQIRFGVTVNDYTEPMPEWVVDQIIAEHTRVARLEEALRDARPILMKMAAGVPTSETMRRTALWLQRHAAALEDR